MARLRCCRFAGREPSSRGWRARWYSHSSSPVAPSIACTRSPGLAMYSTPPYASGVVCCDPSASAQLQTSRSSPAFAGVISSSGLWPWASRVRRQWIQSPASGFCSTASVTGRKSSSACACAVPPPPAAASAAIPAAHSSRRRPVRPSFVRRVHAAPARFVMRRLRAVPPRAAVRRAGSRPMRQLYHRAIRTPACGRYCYTARLAAARARRVKGLDDEGDPVGRAGGGSAGGR